MNIGFEIKKMRKKLGLTQEELATKCNLSKNAIWNYENNKRNPTTYVLSKIAESLGISTYQLLGSDVTPVDFARLHNDVYLAENDSILDYPIDKEKFLSILSEKNLTINDVSEMAQVSLKRVQSVVDDDVPTLLRPHIQRIAESLNIDESDLILNSNGMSILDMNLRFSLERYLVEKGLDNESAIEKSNEIFSIINTMVEHSLK